MNRINIPTSCLLAAVQLILWPGTVCALGAEALLSRIKTAQCEVLMSVGRIPGTAMPPEWAASGAKLGLPLEIEFTDEACAQFEMNKERLLGEGRPSFLSVEPLNEPSFISQRGQERVKVTSGAYGCELQQIEAQQYSFRFFLDFPEGAVRNDVELPAERIYFMSSCWIENQRVLERAQKLKEDMLRSLKEVNEELQEKESSSRGFLQQAMGLRQSVLLIERRKKLEAQLNELDQTYPLRSEDLMRGPNGILFVKEGVIAVKRFRGTMGTREQYHWVGTFSFTEFFDDEYEDEDEEN